MRNQKRIMKTLLLITLVIAMIASCLCGCKDESKEKSNGAESATAAPNKSDNNGENTVDDVVYKVGEYITFGTYEQDNDTLNGKEKIEWRVLEVKDGNALVISKYALDCQRFSSDASYLWEKSSIRTWLNVEFLKNAFSDAEREKIYTTQLSGLNDNVSDNKVFLLSADEVDKYYASDRVRQCEPTLYVGDLAAPYILHENDEGVRVCNWLLRSNHPEDENVDVVYYDGSVGTDSVSDYGAVRPAMWIGPKSKNNLDESFFEQFEKGNSETQYINANCKIGDYVLFGEYEQNNETDDGKESIEWLVLDKQEGKVLVVSKYALDSKPYNDEYGEEITWETCSLRQWLNNDFFNDAFSDKEKNMVYVESESDDNVFLLSCDEANKYFINDRARICEGTPYTMSNGIYDAEGDNTVEWWLRTSGTYELSDMYDYTRAATVFSRGWINTMGQSAYTSYDDFSVVVRPALWIALD